MKRNAFFPKLHDFLAIFQLSALILLICISLTKSSGCGAAYYVSATGNDSNPGTEAQPWRTIQHACDTMAAGDSVFIRGGLYNESVQTMNSGNAENGHILFSAYSGEKPIIEGTGVEANNGFINPDIAKMRC